MRTRRLPVNPEVPDEQERLTFPRQEPVPFNVATKNHRGGTAGLGVTPATSAGMSRSGRPDGLAAVTVPVHGMTCEGCAATVQLSLGRMDGVADVEVDIGGARAVVSGVPEALDPAALRAKVEELGYDLDGATTGDRADPLAPWKLALAVIGVSAVIIAGTVVFQQAASAYLVAESLQRLNALFAEVSLAAIGLAALLGVVVAFAPSTYAMAPAVMGYVTGARAHSTRQATKLSAAFVAGVVAVDMAVGALFAVGGAAAMRVFTARLPLWYALITVALAGMAVVTLGIWRPKLPSFAPRLRNANGAGGAFALGVPFGLMACPSCTPLLLPVALGAAATGDPLYGAALMGAFAVGRGLPLVALGAFTGVFQGGRRVARWVPHIEKGVGVLLLFGAGWFLYAFFGAGGFGALL